MRCVLVVAAIAAGCVGGCGFEPAGGAPVGPTEPVDAVAEADAPELDGAADDAGSGPDTTVDAALDAAPAPDAIPPLDASPVEQCSNGRDDDGDGDPDCRDDDCGACPGITSCCASGACALVCLA